MKVMIYTRRNGRSPFIEWYNALKDKSIKLRIMKRIKQIEIGHFGDSKYLGNEVYELRFFFGKGYRVYYATSHDLAVILLCAGDKSNQSKDIDKAQRYWQDYKDTSYDNT